MANRIVYFEDFASLFNTQWYNIESQSQNNQLIEFENEQTFGGFIRSSGPFWFDPNHIDSGLSYVHLPFFAYEHEIIGQPAIGFDYNNAEISLSIRSEMLNLPVGAHLYFWFQSYDSYIGRYVNYVLTAQPIDVLLVDGQWVNVTLTLSANDADWTPLGSSNARSSMYGQSLSIVQALSADVIDFGILVVTGSGEIGAQTTGALSFDNISVTISSDGSRSFNENTLTQGPAPLRITGDISNLNISSFDGAILDIGFSSSVATFEQISILPIQTDDFDTISQFGNAISFQGEVVGTLSETTNGMSILLSGSATREAIEAIMYQLAYSNPSNTPLAQREITVTLRNSSLSNILATLTVTVIDQPESDGDDVYTFDGPSAFQIMIDDRDGFDIIDASLADNDLAILLQPAAVVSAHSIYTSTGTNIEQVFGGFGSDFIAGSDSAETIHGGPSRDNIYGNAGNDRLYGDGGNDNIDGGLGRDYIDGGEGQDAVFYSRSIGGISLNLVDFRQNSGEALGDVLISIEIIIASNFGDLFYGDDNRNIVYGLNGADIFFSLAGNDVLYGNEGNDELCGGAGADHLDGGVGNDTAVYTTALTGVRADLSGLVLGLGDAYGDIYIGIENLTGSTFADALYGDANDNRLSGGAGNDLLTGGVGADQLIGGIGDDIYILQDSDVILEIVGEGYDTIRVATNYRLADGIEIERLESANPTSTTSQFLIGNNLSNLVIGNAGVNRINGGAGSDLLTGMGGKDYFDFTTALGSNNVDTITDFYYFDDLVFLDKRVFTGLISGFVAENAFFSGNGATSATTENQRIIHDQSTGDLYFDIDGIGGAEAIIFAKIGANNPIFCTDLFIY